MDDRPVDEATWFSRMLAELGGTFVLVFGLIATAVFSASFDPHGSHEPYDNVGILGVAAGLGLSAIVAGYAFGGTSGGHFNPAVTLGLAAAGRFRWADVPGYVVSQFIGATAAASFVAFLAHQGGPYSESAALHTGYASNGWGAQSPAGYDFTAAASVEILAAATLVAAVITATKFHPKVAPAIVAATLAMLLLGAIPIDNASINPARSFGTAVWAGGDWFAQVWLFLLAPSLGGVIAGLLSRLITAHPTAAPAVRSHA